MSGIIYGASIALIVLFLTIGFLVGLIRGVKRSAVHIAFVVVSIVISFFITRPIVNAILGISINIDGSVMPISEYILTMINDNVMDLSSFDSASAFIQGLPSAVASPIVFIVVMILVYFVIDIIYLIVARIIFGRKKIDFENHKAHRLPGGLVGIVEACLFTFVLFAPITSLTTTYGEIVSHSTTTEVATQQDDKVYLQTIGDITSQNITSEVNEIVTSFNNSAVSKICSIGGINDKIFDGLSSFEVNDEKIYIRDELVTIAEGYDSFVIFYNNVVDENFADLDFSTVKNAMTHVVQNGLFKAVIADTISDFVVNFNQIEADLNIEMPEIALDIIETLQTRFSSEDFDAYAYISNDLLSLLNIADSVVTNDSLADLINLNTGDVTEILEFATDYNTLLSTTLQSFADLNLVKDTLPIILESVNDSLAQNFENNDGLIVGLNAGISNEGFKNTIATLFNGDSSIISQIKSLNDQYDILSILNSDDVLDTILSIDGIDEALTQFGSVIDDFNELEIFNYIDSNTQTNVHSFENILILSGIDALGDEVYLNNGVEMTTQVLDTYEKFFSYISSPIKTIIDSNLVDLLDENADFDSIMDIIASNISGVSESEKNLNFLADIIMPFYELDQASFGGQTLKDLVFTNVVNILNENLSEYIDLSTTPETDNYQTWEDRLVSVASLIDTLNSGEITTEYQESMTYLKYLLSADLDYLELVTTMNNDGVIAELLNIIFGNSMYQPLNAKLFATIDEQIGQFTTVDFTTNIDNLSTNKDAYINVVTSLISYIDDGLFESEDLTTQLTAIGGILNLLKESAQVDVFDEVFANLIWYITGDVIDVENADLYLNKTTPFEYADKVKEYFDADSQIDGYYGIDYLAQVEDLVDFIEFGSQIVESLQNADLTTEIGRQEFIQSIDQTIHSLGDNAQEIVDTAVDLVEVVLSDEQLEEIQAQGAELASTINEYVSATGALTPEIKNSLLQLFGIVQ